jgi:lambda family phage tail tape measure protein
MAATQVREIKVVIDTKGDQSLKAIAAGFGRMNKSIQQTNGILGSFQNAFKSLGTAAAGFIGFNLVREFVSVADSMQKLRDRLTLSEGSTADAGIALGKLGDVANRTKSGIEDIATIYNRLNLSLRETGISSAALIELTEVLQNTFRLSGATAAEATAATIQLSQGLASGQVRGQELRSVLEQNALVGELLAKKLGKTRGELLKFAEKSGGISATTVMAALADEMGNVNSRAEKLTPTIGEALTTAFNKLKIELDETNKQFGLTEKAVKAIEFAGANLGVLTLALGAAVVGWKLYTKWALISAAATKTFYLVLASPLIGALVAAGVALAAFLGTTGGVVLAVTAAVASIVGLLAFSSKTRDFFTSIGAGLKSLFTFKDGKADSLPEAFRKAGVAMDNANVSQRNYVLETPAVIKSFYEIDKAAATGYGSVLKMDTALQDFTKTGMKVKTAFDFEKELAKLNQQFLKDKDLTKYNAALKAIEIQKLNEDFRAGKLDQEEFAKRMREIQFGKGISSLKEFRGELSALNKEFAMAVTTGHVTEYAQALEQVKLDKLSRDLREGRTSWLEYQKEINASQLNQFNRELVSGTRKFQDYRAQSQAVQLAQLNAEWRAGTMDIYAYHKAVTEVSDEFQPNSAFFTGANDYISQAGTLSQGIAGGITNTFKTLEDTFVAFTKNGKFAFKDFAKAVLEDLNRIIIRSLIIRPLAQGIVGSIGNSPQQGAPSTYGGRSSDYQGIEAAKGAFFDGGKANFFAKGGVVNGVTPFTYGRGRSGIMGEAGPEAILPLKRDGSGNLGVQASGSNVIVNIHNESGGQVEQKESKGPNGERVLDIIITQKMKEAFANGSMDKQMTSQYGLRRKGI